jgi:hypothetical protein
MTSLRIDAPLSECPPVEQCVAGVFVFDRTRSAAVKALREVLGTAAADGVLQSRGRWLFLTIGRAGAGVLGVDSETDVVHAHRGLLHVPAGSGHLEIFHYLAPELRQRIIDDARLYQLRAMPTGGRA